MKTGRVPTGISGLDDLISGGFPEETVNLVSGPAGSAKSLIAMQFIYNGVVNQGETGIYLTLEEPRENIIRAMTAYGMDIEKYEKEGKLLLLDMGEVRKRADTDEDVDIVGFEGLKQLLDNMLKFSGAKRLLRGVSIHLDKSLGGVRPIRVNVRKKVPVYHVLGVVACSKRKPSAPFHGGQAVGLAFNVCVNQNQLFELGGLGIYIGNFR